MPSPLATSVAKPEGKQSAPTPLVPFVKAAQRQTIPANIDEQRTLTANGQQVGVFELPAAGFLRSVQLLVTFSGGAGGSAVAEDDAPWSIIDQITLEDPSGRPIYGPVSGYSLFLSNLAGGYTNQVDPTAYNAYSALDANGNGSFLLSIPVEASGRDGYASLINQDSSAAYRVRISMAGSGDVFATPPAGNLPDVRFQAWVDLWTQPTPTNLAGQAQQQTPPGSGTLQMWTRETNPISAGTNTVRVKRVGNLFRNLLLVVRDASGDRVANTNLPDPIRIQWDNLTLTDEGLGLRLNRMEEAYGVAFPNGVVCYTFCDDLDGKPGFELRNALLPTTTGTRLEINGSFGVAGSMEVLVNDIIPVGLI